MNNSRDWKDYKITNMNNCISISVISATDGSSTVTKSCLSTSYNDLFKDAVVNTPHNTAKFAVPDPALNRTTGARFLASGIAGFNCNHRYPFAHSRWCRPRCAGVLQTLSISCGIVNLCIPVAVAL